MPVQTQLQMRRDTAANWTSTNPTLASGEWGLETDTRLMKIGDGATAWNSLGYQLNSLLDEDLATDLNGAYFDGTGLRLYGTSGNFATSPDSAALDITGDIDIRVKASLADWTPPNVENNLIAKYITTTNQRSYQLRVIATGVLRAFTSTNGSNFVQYDSTVATGLADGATKWVRFTLDVDNGAGGKTAAFYLSDDGTNWTQLGADVTTAGTTSIFNSTAILEIGSGTSGTVAQANGTIYRAQVLNGIDGTTVFDADFETVPADSFAFTESSANAATVTLTTTRYSFGLPNTTLLSTSNLAIGANNDFYYQFRVVGKPITVKHICFEVVTNPAAAANVYLGLYAATSGMQPTGNALFASGAVAVSTSGAGLYRVRATPFTLNPGNYLVALNTSNTVNFRMWLTATGFALNTLGNGVAENYRNGRTNGAFTNSPTNWTTRALGTTPRNGLLLGWS